MKGYSKKNEKKKCWLSFSLGFMCLMFGNMKNSPSVKNLQKKEQKIKK
jgi:hypothetical protein